MRLRATKNFDHYATRVRAGDEIDVPDREGYEMLLRKIAVPADGGEFPPEAYAADAPDATGNARPVGMSTKREFTFGNSAPDDLPDAPPRPRGRGKASSNLPVLE